MSDTISVSQVTASLEILRLVSQVELRGAIARHAEGDWGSITEEMNRENNTSRNTGSGDIVSWYSSSKDIPYTVRTDLKNLWTRVDFGHKTH